MIDCQSENAGKLAVGSIPIIYCFVPTGSIPISRQLEVCPPQKEVNIYLQVEPEVNSENIAISTAIAKIDRSLRPEEPLLHLDASTRKRALQLYERDENCKRTKEVVLKVCAQ